MRDAVAAMGGTAVIFAFISIPFVMFAVSFAQPSRSVVIRWLLGALCIIQVGAFTIGRANEEMLFFTLPVMLFCVVASLALAFVQDKRNTG